MWQFKFTKIIIQIKKIYTYIIVNNIIYFYSENYIFYSTILKI